MNIRLGVGEKLTLGHVLMVVAVIICLLPFTSAAVALILGIAVAVTVGNPFLDRTRKITHQLLTLSVVGLGAGMNLNTVAEVGMKGFGYTVIGIGFALLVGTFLGKLFKTSE